VAQDSIGENVNRQFDDKDVFPQKSSVGDRPWGTEELLALVPGKFTVKLLTLRAGSKGGLQFHRLKDEVAVLISGELLIRYDLGDSVLRERNVMPGEAVHFLPGLVHQEEAILDCVILEASTPHFNDRVRVELAYGLGAPVGLPTTDIEDIDFQ
jgi:mannose-6-phosphate isomerase-like protein (cupin superfamily)